MKMLSRHMPRFVPSHPTPAQRVACVVLCGAALGAVIYAFSQATLWTGIAVAGLLVAAALSRYDLRRALRRIAAPRIGHSICEFRAAFDVHSVDPWVIRAVFEQIQAYLEGEFKAFPLHAEDRLIEDLRIDEDDLEWNIAEEVAQRTGRNLPTVAGRSPQPPVKTAGDLVLFFNALPQVPTVAQAK